MRKAKASGPQFATRRCGGRCGPVDLHSSHQLLTGKKWRHVNAKNHIYICVSLSVY